MAAVGHYSLSNGYCQGIVTAFLFVQYQTPAFRGQQGCCFADAGRTHVFLYYFARGRDVYRLQLFGCIEVHGEPGFQLSDYRLFTFLADGGKIGNCGGMDVLAVQRFVQLPDDFLDRSGVVCQSDACMEYLRNVIKGWDSGSVVAERRNQQD